MSVTQNLNELSNVFLRSISDVQLAENRDAQLVHLKTITAAFTQVFEMAETFAIHYEKTKEELEAMTEKCIEYESKANSYDLAIKELHLLMNAKTIGEHKNSNVSYQRLSEEVQESIEKTRKHYVSISAINYYATQNERLISHVNQLSKKLVMQRIGSRFFAREVALARQMMDLIRNARSIDAAAKSKVWDQLEVESQMLRLNTIWLINRINGDDREGKRAYDDFAEVRSAPRVIILMRTHKTQGLGIEITGGSKSFKDVVISGKLKGSMADDDELKIGDRIIAVDGTFVTSSTTHEEVMEMLRNESTKDYVALIVSSFNPWMKGDPHQPRP